MATLMGSILILIYTALKRHYIFIINFGLSSLIILAILCILRLVLPVEFPEHQYIFSIYMGFGFTDYLSSFERLLKIVIIIMIIGCIVSVIKMFIQQMQFYQYLNTCEATENTTAEKVLSEIDRNHRVQIKQISGISVPMITGFVKPTIYLPNVPYTDTELYYVILHEYTHWKNKDLHVKLFVNTILAVFWWNPIVYLLLKNLDQTLELKCDYKVLRRLTDDEQTLYLETLLHSLKNIGTCNLPCNKAVFSSELVNISNQPFIRQRFFFIANSPATSTNLLFRLLFLGMSIFFMIISYIIIVQPQFDVPSAEIWDKNVDVIYELNDVYIEKRSDGTFFLHLNNENTIKLTEEEVYRDFYDGYEIRETK